MGITVAVGVVVGFVTVAGVTIGRILALGVDLFPAIAAAVTLLGVDTTGVGLILAVGGSEVLALTERKNAKINEITITILYKVQMLYQKRNVYISVVSVPQV